jgi:hypothetical protein
MYIRAYKPYWCLSLKGYISPQREKGNSVEGPSTLRGESLKRLLPECRIIFARRDMRIVN